MGLADTENPITADDAGDSLEDHAMYAKGVFLFVVVTAAAVMAGVAGVRWLADTGSQALASAGEAASDAVPEVV